VRNLRPGGQQKKRDFSLTRGWRPFTLGLARAEPDVTRSARLRHGKEVNRQVTLTISHEKTREITREEVDRAIDVIERHLEKEARTRNLLDEQAIMRPKDLCKQQGLDMVAELRGMI
jgi:hypothetical protein